MINLDQVRTLEWKVKQAVQLIVHLRRENDALRGRLSDAEVRLQELDSLMESFKATQNEMESGIRNALEDLDNLEEGTEPAPVGPVAALSYPPAPSAPAEAEPQTVTEPDPQETSLDAAPAEVVSEPAREPSFEEEYAALAAAEAEALAREAEEAPAPEPVEAAPAPDSIELEDVGPAADQDEESLFLETAESEPEPEPVVPEEKQPEQPGLGIF